MSLQYSKRLILVLLGAISVMVLATPTMAETSVVKIALIEDSLDPRYSEPLMDARLQAQPWGRLSDAINLAIKETRFAAQAAGYELSFSSHKLRDKAELASLVEDLKTAGTQLFLLDLTAADVRRVAQLVKNSDSAMFNLTALDDSLREEFCQDNLFHIAPSRSMLTDALSQYLKVKKWKRLLVLYGTNEHDRQYLEAMLGSAKKFGLKVVDQKEWVLGNDPRHRYQNNIQLLTGGEDYDVVVALDHEGEFSADMPYAILKPRPVVGSAGLVPDWWHWSWGRNGAPQVNKRFYNKSKRPMTGYDWAAWLSVKIHSEVMLRSGITANSNLVDHLNDAALKVDGAKGYPLNFRGWNNQLRQPIFLTSANRVIVHAPLEGFLHPTNNLDILGKDIRESQCHLKARIN